ncbi:MAG: response regulator [Armatimonadota bacterium]
MLHIVLVDDHQIVRQGLRALLERQPDFRVVGEAANGRDAIRIIQQHTPEVVIMDVAMPDLNGIEATRQIHTLSPHAKIIALSMHAEKAIVQDMLRAGASGYILKESAYDELVDAIRATQHGQIFLSQQLVNLVLKDYVERLDDRTTSRLASLSPREREVWQLIAEGNNNPTIAEQLHLSVRTVETHRKNLMEKLEITSVAELTRVAIREGLITL